MTHEIPAFLKLNIDGYPALGKPVTRPRAAQEPRAKRKLTTPSHQLDDHQLANSISALALASVAGGANDEPALLSLWQDHWRGVDGKSECDALGRDLLAAYRDPARVYHGTTHLIECLRLWREWREDADKPDEVAVALWFHDAIYDATRHDSEARSARWALDALSGGGVPFDTVRRIRDLVIATRANETPSSEDARLIVDIDMAIYGAEARQYDRYEADLQGEHAHMADFIYRRKRLEWLKSLANRPRIYHTSAARRNLESSARENIARSVSRLADRTSQTGVAGRDS